MNLPTPADIALGKVTVVTSSNGGLPPEYWAKRIVDKLVYIGDEAPEPIRQQAHAFREQMFAVVLAGLKKAIASDRAYWK